MKRDVESPPPHCLLVRLGTRIVIGHIASLLVIAWIYTVAFDRSLSVELFTSSSSFRAGVDSQGWHFAQISATLSFAPAPWTFQAGAQDGLFHDVAPTETPMSEWQRFGASHRAFWRFTGIDSIYSVQHWASVAFFVVSVPFVALFRNLVLHAKRRMTKGARGITTRCSRVVVGPQSHGSSPATTG
jgi:hypothetical protein